MKRLAILFFLLFSLKGNAQDLKVIDSLRIKLKSSLNDSITLDLLIRIHDEYKLYNPDSTLLYLNRSIEKNNALKNQYLGAQLSLRQSSRYVQEGNLSEALKVLETAKDYFENKNDKETLRSIYYEYAAIHYSASEYNLALNYNTKTIELLQSYDDKSTDEWKDNFAKLYHFRAAILIESGFPNEAKPYLNDGIDIVASSRIKAPLLQVLAYIYISEEKLDSAKVILDQALILCHETQEPHACYSTHIELGKLQRQLENLDKSTHHYEQALFYAEKSGYTHSIMNVLQGRSNLEVAKGNYPKASKYFEETNKLFEAHPELIVQADFYKFWGEVENELGNYKKSAALLLKHFELNDSTLSKQNREIVADLETKYDVAQKEKDLMASQLELEKNKGQRNLFFSLGLFSLLGGLFFWNRNRKNKEISFQKSLLQKQKIDQLEKEKKILGMNAMIEGQEAERTRIAKDLHDGLGGLLSTVKAHFSNVQSEIQKIEKLNVFNRANKMMDEACDEVRRISHNLMPGALRLEGLKVAIENLGDEMNAAHPFNVSVEMIQLESRLEESKEVFVYRIIQEAFNNITRHAEAKNVLVQMSETSEELHIIIEDDGKGFDMTNVRLGLGLKSIQSRVDFLEGKLDIDAKQNIGTTLTIHLPK